MTIRTARTALTIGTVALVSAACSTGPFAVAERDERGAASPSTSATGEHEPTSSSRPGGAGGTVGRGLPFALFDSCDAFVESIREPALASVSAYGFGGWGITPAGGRVFAMEDAAATTAAAASDAGGAIPEAAPAPTGTEAPASSSTNVQESGVDEGDLVETDGRHVFSIVDGATLRIVDTIDGVMVATVRLDPDTSVSQMVLDGDRIALVLSSWGGGPLPLDDRGRAASDFGYGFAYGLTGVRVIDVADRAAPVELGTTWFEGAAQAVRSVDGSLRVVMTSGLGDRLPFVVPANGSLAAEERAELINREVIEEATAAEWLPRRIDERDGATTEPVTAIGCDRIGTPAEFSGFGLTWIASVDLRAAEPDAVGSTGVVSTGGTTYATAERLYVTTVPWTLPTDGVVPLRPEGPSTAVHSFALTGRTDAVYEASGAVEGTVLNQFSMSERDELLRVATTTFDPLGGTSESQLRVLERSGDTWGEVAALGGLGTGEQIYAVRFIGDLAYVVTFRQVDPLHVIDLTDGRAPVLRGELEIPGYSAYLHPVSDGLLLGIGQDATDQGQRLGAQASLFDVSDPDAPTRVATASLGSYGTSVEWDHRAFLYWPATGQMVVPVDPAWCETPGATPANAPAPSPECDPASAVVVQVGADSLTVQGRLTHEDGAAALGAAPIVRSLVVDGRLVTVSATGVQVTDLATLTPLHWVPFT